MRQTLHSRSGLCPAPGLISVAGFMRPRLATVTLLFDPRSDNVARRRPPGQAPNRIIRHIRPRPRRSRTWGYVRPLFVSGCHDRRHIVRQCAPRAVRVRSREQDDSQYAPIGLSRPDWSGARIRTDEGSCTIRRSRCGVCHTGRRAARWIRRNTMRSRKSPAPVPAPVIAH